jgi:hypothetical protein
MFLAVVTRNESNRAIQEHFQHSGETVHRYFYAALQAFVCLHEEVVLLPSPAIVPGEIRWKTRFWLYIKDCIGALDGSHIRAHMYLIVTPLGFATARAFSVRMYLLLIPLTCGFAMFLLGEKGQHTIPGYSVMLVQTQTSSSPMTSTALQMPVMDSNVAF